MQLVGVGVDLPFRMLSNRSVFSKAVSPEPQCGHLIEDRWAPSEGTLHIPLGFIGLIMALHFTVADGWMLILVLVFYSISLVEATQSIIN